MEDKEKGKNKKLHGCVVVLLVIAAFAAVAGSLFYAFYWYIPGNTREAALMLESGRKNYEAAAALPEVENGLKDYMEASSKMNYSALKIDGDLPEKTEKVRRWVEFGIDKSEKAKAEKFLTDNNSVLEIIAKGDKKSFVIPSELPAPSVGGYTPAKSSVKYESMLEETAQFLMFSGRMKMEEGRFKDAAENFFSVLGISRGPESFDKAHFLRWQLFGRAESELVKIISLAKDGDPVFKYIMDAGRKLEPELPDIGQTLETSLYFCHRIADQVKLSMNGPGMPYYIKYIPVGFVMARELKILDTEMVKTEKLVKQDGFACLKYLENRQPDKRSFFFSVYSNEEIKIKVKCALLKKTYLNGLITAAALRQYKSDKGSYPEKLEDLTPDYLSSVPHNYTSPDGKFIYRKSSPSEVLLYCAGPDLSDQGGNDSSGDDAVFLKTKK
ncbi:MAG: hypothetical protein LWY06_14120 [Firmicutes bacterium]|nr:hypothetical protein [Bacillota bacterium]